METIRDYNATGPLFLTWGFSFATGIVSISAQFLAPHFSQQGVDLIDSFFIYLLLTQFTHLGWTHLGLNLAGLVILNWGFSGQRSAGQWFWIQCLSFVWVAFYLARVEPMAWYCGLSGALHFQFAACLVIALVRNPRGLAQSWPLWMLALGFVFKLVLEWHSAPTEDTLLGGPIAYAAHRGGAAGGVVFGLCLSAWMHRKLLKPSTGF